MTPEQIRKHLGVSSLDATFETFKVENGSEDAFKAARLISTLNTEWQLLLIYGRWGNGKTHLLESIANDLWKRGISAQVRTFPSFVERLKSTFDRAKGSQDSSFDDVMQTYCSMEHLLLDDVGAAGSFTEWSLQQLERIMLARYRDNLFTVMTTNLDLSKIPDFVVSRFSDAVKGRMVLNDAEDYRPKKVSGGKL